MPTRTALTPARVLTLLLVLAVDALVLSKLPQMFREGSWFLAGAVLIAGVCCALFGNSDDPAPSILAFFYGTIIGLVISAVYAFAILPRVTDFVTLAAVLAPPMLIGGMFLARPATLLMTLGGLLGALNTVGLRRAGFSDADIESLKDAVRRLWFGRKKRFAQELAEFDVMNGINPRVRELVKTYLNNWYNAGGGLFNWFVAGPTNWKAGAGTWGLTDQIDNLTSPKLLATLDVANAPRQALKYGIAVPAAFDARAIAGATRCCGPA